jgi:ABC-type uncharacterized transport system substrate-binding protein
MAIDIRRREFIFTLGGAAAVWPLAARAQQARRLRRVAVMAGSAEGDIEVRARVAALRQGLEELGWMEGRNINIHHRWAGADLDQLRTSAAELVAMAPDVLFGAASPATAALHQATKRCSAGRRPHGRSRRGRSSPNGCGALVCWCHSLRRMRKPKRA